MSKKLKVTEDRVKEAAASCSTAKQVLEKLFPEVFEKKLPDGDFLVKAGTRVKRRDSGEIYLVARPETNVYSLVSLDDGNRWNSSKGIEDTQFGLSRLLDNPRRVYEWELA